MTEIVWPNGYLAANGFGLQDDIVLTCNGRGFKKLLQAGKQWLELHVRYVNDLNVFPVPDGDTGTNMLLTLQSALKKVAQHPDYDVESVALAAAQGALMGARGNSGLILSQFLTGMATGFKGKVFFNAVDLAYAVGLGATQAYQSVVEPVEGTILTVSRAIAEAAHRSARDNPDLQFVLSEAVAAAKTAQAKTPELLPVLKDAGVIDLGGQGLLFIFEGGLRFLRDDPLNEAARSNQSGVHSIWTGMALEGINYGFDLQFVLKGEQLKLDEIRTHIAAMGRSPLVVGDENLVKVHVHVNNPDEVLSYGAKFGRISEVFIEDMDEQARAFVASQGPLPAGIRKEKDTVAEIKFAAIVIASSPGLAKIFQSLEGDAIIIANPDQVNQETLLERVNGLATEQLVVLADSLAGRSMLYDLQSGSAKKIALVPSCTVPQGIAALLSLNYEVDVETNARRMLDAAHQVGTIEIGQAVESRTLNGFDIGVHDIIGFYERELISVGPDDETVILDMLSKIEMRFCEVLTIYFGQNREDHQAEKVRNAIQSRVPDLEIDIYDGGQSLYHYIISLE